MKSFFKSFLTLLFFLPVIAAAQVSVTAGEDIELLKEYLKIPSVSGNERAAGKFLAENCRQKGLEVEVFDNEEGSYNFAASIYPLSSGKPNIILLNHIDVVPVEDPDAWEEGPYAGKEKDGYLYGRGALDMKGLAVMQLLAVKEIADSAKKYSLDYNVTLLSVSGEETGGQQGSKKVVNEHLELLNPVVVFGEGGSGMKDVVASRPELPVFGICVAEKRNVWLRLELKNETHGHGSTPPSQYPGKRMLKALDNLMSAKKKIRFTRVTRRMFDELGRLEGGMTGFAFKNIHLPFFRPVLKKRMKSEPMLKAFLTNTVTLTKINTPPGPPNQISSKVTAVLDCRLLPGTDSEKFIRQLKRDLDEPDIEISIIDEGPEGPATKPDDFYTFCADALKEHYSGAEVAPILLPASSDNNYFRSRDIPVYGIMPLILSDADLNSIHSSNERISLADFRTGAKVFISFLSQAVVEPVRSEVASLQR